MQDAENLAFDYYIQIMTLYCLSWKNIFDELIISYLINKINF